MKKIAEALTKTSEEIAKSSEVLINTLRRNRQNFRSIDKNFRRNHLNTN